MESWLGEIENGLHGSRMNKSVRVPRTSFARLKPKEGVRGDPISALDSSRAVLLLGTVVPPQDETPGCVAAEPDFPSIG